MDGTLMIRWINEIYLKYTGNKKSLLVMDTFSAHCSDEIISLLSKHHSRVALIRGGCTSKLQPLDVSLNKPFKQVCRQEFHTSCCYQLATMSSKQTNQRMKRKMKMKMKMILLAQSVTVKATARMRTDLVLVSCILYSVFLFCSHALIIKLPKNPPLF